MVEPAHSFAPPQITEPDQPIIQPFKPRCNPCPCTTLQCGVKIIAVITIVLAIGSLLVYVVALNSILAHGRCDSDITWLMFSYMAASAFHIYLATFLYMGANESSRCKCWVYFIGQVGMILAAIILIIVIFVLTNLKGGENAPVYITAGSFSVYVIIYIYFLVVVYFFIQELKFNSPQVPLLGPYQQF